MYIHPLSTLEYVCTQHIYGYGYGVPSRIVCILVNVNQARVEETRNDGQFQPRSEMRV